MMLRRFVDAEGRLHAFRKAEASNGVFRTAPENLFHQRHLYSAIHADGRWDTALEHQFGGLESEVAPLLDRLTDAALAGTVPGLGRADRDLWYLFFVLQWKRVPDLHLTVTTDAELKAGLEALIAELAAKVPARRDELDSLRSPEAQRRLMQNARVGSIQTVSNRVMDSLRSRGIALAVAPPGKRFIVGSRPVVKFTAPGKTHIGHPECEMWLPISGDVIVGLGTGPDRETIYRIGSDAVRRINLGVASQSTTIASSSRRLVESLANAR